MITTIAEFMRYNDKPGYSIDISPWRGYGGPFVVRHLATWDTFDVRLTDLPPLVELPKPDKARADFAARALAEPWRDYITLIVAESPLTPASPDALALLRQRANAATSRDAERRADATLELLRWTMAPRPFLAAVARVREMCDANEFHDDAAHRIASAERTAAQLAAERTAADPLTDLLESLSA